MHARLQGGSNLNIHTVENRNASRYHACGGLSGRHTLRPGRVYEPVQRQPQGLSKGSVADCEPSHGLVSARMVLPYGRDEFVYLQYRWQSRKTKCWLDIHLITPPESLPALEAALSQNPHLTSLPSPKPTLLAPSGLDLTTGTAEIFRLPEVQAAITGDFIVLPCDLVCELSGTPLLESWMTTQGGLGGATGGEDVYGTKMGLGGEQSGRRGGLGVWYQTKDAASGGVGVKGEETDLLATTFLPPPSVRPHHDSLLPNIHSVALTMPTAILKDVIEEDKALKIRHALLRKHGRVRMLTTYRDAHIYFFPHWVKEFIGRNEAFESIGEDVLGWWTKAGWQDGLAAKLQFDKVLQKKRRKSMPAEEEIGDQPDIASLSTTSGRRLRGNTGQDLPPGSRGTDSPVQQFASRVTGILNLPERVSLMTPIPKHTSVPSLLAYVQPTLPAADLQPSSTAPSKTLPLIRRVDTTALLLSVSLRLARLPSLEECNVNSSPASPFAHALKVAESSSVPQRATVTRIDSLIDANCTIAEKTAIKECVVGVNCTIGVGARLTRCVLMEGAVVGERAVLSGSVIGRRAKIGKESELKDCFVEEGFAVPDETIAKSEVFAGFDEGEAMSDEDEEDMDDDAGEEEQEEDEEDD